MKNKLSTKIIVAIISLLIVIILSLALIFKHTHSFGEWEKVRDPSCSQKGLDRRYCDCGDIQEREFEKLSHTEGDWVVNDDANERRLLCSVCSQILKIESLRDHTHDWSEWTTVKDATCEEEGSKTRFCECGATQDDPIDALEHDFSEWITTKEPACEVLGIRERSCECGEHQTEDIPALEHLEDEWKILGNEKHFPCVHCGITVRIENINFSIGLDIVNGVVMGLGTCQDKDIIIPSVVEGTTVTAIDRKAFQYTNITSIVIPNSITTIGEKAFYDCPFLQTVSLGEGVTSIGSQAFYACSSLKSITIPSGIITLEQRTFAYCESLERIYIPSSVTEFEVLLFEYCSELVDIYFDGTTAQWNAIDKQAGEFDTPNYTIHCSDGDIKR